MRPIVPLLLFILCVSCASDKETSPHGIEITYLERGTGSELEIGKILMMFTRYTTEEGKVIAESSYEQPLALYNEQNPIEKGGLLKDVINQLRIGDSVYFEIPANNLYEVSFQLPIPDSIGKNSSIHFYMRIFEQLSKEEYDTYSRELEIEVNAEKYDQELINLDNYLAENKIIVTLDSSGLRWILQEKGNGLSPVKGDLVSVQYRGTTLDGRQFDAGVYDFKIGYGEVIKGWDLGIELLKPGSEAVLYIPSKLAYGSRGSGMRIPPFASLIFEVKLLNIKKGNEQ
jgi:FKBP-type peptidyl-prolyl cis-trans isomerase